LRDNIGSTRPGGFNLMSPMADMQQMSAKDNHANFQIG